MMKAAVICEDHTLDEYIVKPVVEQVFRELGNKVNVTVVSQPRLRGVDQALDATRVAEIINRYPMANVFFLIVDRDGDEHREGRLAERIREAEDKGKTMFGCLAVEELEVWALALHRKELSADWNDVRAERDPKEAYFEPFVRQQNWQLGPGKGRKAAMQDLRARWDSLKSLCPEVQQLAEEVNTWLNAES